MRRTSLAVLLLSHLSLAVGAQTVNVTNVSCDQEYDLEETGTVTLEYFGADLGAESVCKVKFYSDDQHNDLCIAAIEFVNGCQVRVEYHEGQFQSYSPDHSFCHTQPPSEWCSSFTILFISFEKNKPTSIEGKVSIRLQIRTKSTRSPEHNSAVFSLSLLIGVIVFAAVVLIALVVVAVVLHCRRRQAKRPQRYRTRQTATPADRSFAGVAVSQNETPSADFETGLELATRSSDNPGADNPGAYKPGADNPGVDNAGADNPGAYKPGADNPGVDNAGADKPGAANSSADKPGVGNLGAANPHADKPGVGNPGANNVGADKPGVGNLGANYLGAANERAANPGADKPVVGNLGANNLGAANPCADKPGANNLVAANPSADKPGVDNGGVDNPAFEWNPQSPDEPCAGAKDSTV